MVRAITSAPKPPVVTASCTTSSRPVRATEAATASSSQGQRVRRSSTSAETPRAASVAAAPSTAGTMADQVTMVRSDPSRMRRAWPKGIGAIVPATSPFSGNRFFGSKNSTGSSLRIAETSRPAVSAGVAGTATTTPGICVNQLSSVWECCAAELRQMPCGMRTTTAGLAWPPNM